jgi:hypothetical protein
MDCEGIGWISRAKSRLQWQSLKETTLLELWESRLEDYKVRTPLQASGLEQTVSLWGVPSIWSQGVDWACKVKRLCPLGMQLSQCTTRCPQMHMHSWPIGYWSRKEKTLSKTRKRSHLLLAMSFLHPLLAKFSIALTIEKCIRSLVLSCWAVLKSDLELRQ